jgi:peptide chain release factor 3
MQRNIFAAHFCAAQHFAITSFFMPADNPVSKRRTFAIIAHPDAGKTTLTESCCCLAAPSSLPVK